MITYNHERFIAQALDSVLEQQTTFPYEIVIGDDCSTDATGEILRAYHGKYPDRIRLLVRDKNLGMMGNFMDTFHECRGEFIALLEGDDYWTSSDKLQQQVELLEKHPECSGSFHNVRVVHDGAPEKETLFHERPLAKRFFDLNDIVSAHFIPTCSTLFRAGLYPGLPDWFREMPMGDWPLHILNAEHGSYAYLDTVMASYRVHGGGVWSGSDRLVVLNRTIRACHTIEANTGGRYARKMTRLIRNLEVESAEIHTGQGEFAAASRGLGRAFRVSPVSCTRTVKCCCRLFFAWFRQTVSPAGKGICGRR